MNEVRRQLRTDGDRRSEETFGGPNAEHAIFAIRLVKPSFDVKKQAWDRKRTWGVEYGPIARKPKHPDLKDASLGAKNNSKSKFYIPYLPRGSLVRPYLSIKEELTYIICSNLTALADNRSISPRDHCKSGAAQISRWSLGIMMDLQGIIRKYPSQPRKRLLLVSDMRN